MLDSDSLNNNGQYDELDDLFVNNHKRFRHHRRGGYNYRDEDDFYRYDNDHRYYRSDRDNRDILHSNTYGTSGTSGYDNRHRRDLSWRDHDYENGYSYIDSEGIKRWRRHE